MKIIITFDTYNLSNIYTDIYYIRKRRYVKIKRLIKVLRHEI